MRTVVKEIAGFTIQIFIVCCLLLPLIPGLSAANEKDIPDISDIRLLRKLGEYEEAKRYLKLLIEDRSTPAKVRRSAYNEIVTIFFLAGGEKKMKAAAEIALREFPGLKADPTHYPVEVNQAYNNLRERLFGSIRIETEPENCRIFLDGEDKGLSPVDVIEISVGEHQVRVAKNGFEDRVIQIAVRPDEEIIKTIKLGEQGCRIIPQVEFAMSRVWLNCEQGKGDFLRVGQMVDNEKDYRFNGGFYLNLAKDRQFYLQMGLRYASKGDITHLIKGSDMVSQKYITKYHYLSLPLMARVYLSPKRNIFATAGVEFGYLVTAQLFQPMTNESMSVSDRVERFQVSPGLGAGCEFVMGRSRMVISLIYTMGIVSMGKTTDMYDLDHKTRELRLGVGFLLGE